MNKQEQFLVDLLRISINLKISDDTFNNPEKLQQFFKSTVDKHWTSHYLEQINWDELVVVANNHSVLPIIYDLLAAIPCFPDRLRKKIADKAQKTTVQNYRLLYLSSFLITFLEENGCHPILLKGWQTAILYPVPESRKSGDIDLLIPDRAEFDKAVKLLISNGYKKHRTQHANHHTVLVSEEGISIEVHNMLAEPLDNQHQNLFLKDILKEYKKHTVKREIYGYPITCAEPAYDAFYLLMHMMQHFIRAGFGLKLLCDWALFWSHPVADKEKNTFLRLIKECRCRQFAIVMTRLCVFYLGLDIKNVLFLLKDSETAKKSAYEKLMHDIILSEEFGRSDNNRMVLLKGTHFSSYVKEFHHQMRLNNPKYSKFVVLWPFLWLRTLFVFLRNNHTVRKTTLWSILKQTRKRSSLTEELKIFKN